jgi:acetolactate synthase-1/3 small subunit
MDRSSLRTLIAYVEDVPGVLNRVASLFRRRGYNIDSLTVGRTDQRGVSRMTIVLEADDDAVRRVVANLYKLVNVLRVDDVSRGPAVVSNLALVKVRASMEARAEVTHVAERCRARVVDVAVDAVIVEVTGTQDRIDHLLEAMRHFGIIEMVRTGAVAMRCGGPSAVDQESQPERSAETVAA